VATEARKNASAENPQHSVERKTRRNTTATDTSRY
jgi:hypothetical protein